MFNIDLNEEDQEYIDNSEEFYEENFDKKEHEEVKLLDDKKLAFYEKMRNTINRWVKKKGGKVGNDITQYLLLLPDLFMLLIRLLSDKRVPLSKKIFLTSVVGYLMIPLDIIPDFIPFIGYTDDLILAIFALDNLLNSIDQSIIIDNWSGDANIIETIQTIIAKSDMFLDKNVLNKIKKWIWKKNK